MKVVSILMYFVQKLICRLFFKLVGKPLIIGLENIPQKGPLVLIGNHQSIIDPLALIAYVPRRIIFFAAAYLFKIPVLGLVLKISGVLPVDSKKYGVASVRKGLTRLQQQEVIGLFPEGGVSFDGALKPFHSGWAYLALKNGAPVLPVALLGTRDVLPPRTYLPRRRRVVINFGQPLVIEKREKIKSQDLKELNDLMELQVKGLLKSARQKLKSKA